MQATSGGYVIMRDPLVRTSVEKHTAALDRPVSDLDLKALNAVQATPWRINRAICDIMAEAWDRGRWHGEAFPGIETGVAEPLAPRMEDEVWNALSAADKKEMAAARARKHQRNAAITGRTYAFMDKLLVAQELRDRPAIWFPHTRCFRGRIYPLAVSGPHPQGNDVAKALLEFAQGMPLGDDGLFWLYVRAANAYGHDKLPLEERVSWSIAHLQEMADAASSPFASSFWTQAAEPWSFLASCLEIAEATATSEPAAFIYRLPVPMDGSCNGLQHLSAMALDPVGAKATNLRSDTPRQDIYGDIAAHVRASVERDAASGVPEALTWHGRVTRDVVKRAVMTTPYGVTNQGIRTQLIADGHVPDEGEQKGPAADYLRDRLVEALSASVEAGKGIMAWLQTAASRLADAGLAFEWETPTGSRVRQAYHVQLQTRIRTLVARFQVETSSDMLNGRKQALGSAPNFVHSFDAAHLALTVAAALDDGIGHFAMIHDSFGTHAGKTTLLARILREQFVAMYETDWLAKTAASILEAHPHVDLPPLPERGAFDIAEVLEAPFFFS